MMEDGRCLMEVTGKVLSYRHIQSPLSCLLCANVAERIIIKLFLSKFLVYSEGLSYICHRNDGIMLSHRLYKYKRLWHNHQLQSGWTLK